MKLESLNIITDLFRIRDIAHILHLQTSSYSEHKALNEFYDSWLDLSDQYIEIYQGTYGRIKITYKETIPLNVNNSTALLNSASSLIKVLRSKHPDNTGLNNILDEFLNLINKTNYLLTLS